MKTYSTVESAVELVLIIYEANHNMTNTEVIRKQVYSWYNHTDITDSEMLAACVIQFGYYHPEVTLDDMKIAKHEWFPENPFDNFSIEEIEAAQNDIIYW